MRFDLKCLSSLTISVMMIAECVPGLSAFSDPLMELLKKKVTNI